MDAPNIARKKQVEPVPYLGGVAIALGISIITLGAVFFGAENFPGENNDQLKDLALTVLLPALVLGVMGLIDDLRSLSPWPRLIIQSVVGTFLAFVIVGNGTIGTPFGAGESGSWLNTLVTIVWIVGICNSINFFDNLDGAASGAVAIAAVGVSLIAFDRGQELVSALSIVTAGATFGFLIWNKPPAKIYMGDAGALFLGVVISVSTIRLNPGIEPQWISLSVPLILLGIPILDTSIVVFSRAQRGVSPLTGGMDHLSHRLQRAGCSKIFAVSLLWALAGISCTAAMGVYFLEPGYKTQLVTVYLLSWICLFWLFLRKWI
jgi:UDP-GlcNAc:undecaprenyl-phosphate GlcNAc-1-phosphate transferase